APTASLPDALPVTENAYQALPGQSLFLAQGAGEVGDDQQFMRQATFTKLVAAHFETPAGPAESALQHLHRIAGQHVAQSQRACLDAEAILALAAQQAQAGGVHQPKPLSGIEAEQGDVDGLDDLAQQRARLLDTQALITQRSRQCVDLPDDIANGVIPLCAG